MRQVERAFAQLKGAMDMRPIYHNTDPGMAANTFVAALAFPLHHLRSTSDADRVDLNRWRAYMSKWSTISCAECGTDIHVHEDWSNPPRICKSCKADRDAQWYDKPCADCGTTIRVHRDWENPPKFCKSCKAARDAKWYEKPCESCGTSMKVNRDWDRPPKYCPACKQAHAPKQASCSNCGSSFTISTGIQIKCGENGWDLPKRCDACRELFRHKPFKTVKETDWLGNTVFRTYNSRGQLIGESRNEKGFFGDERRVHRSPTGKTAGVTREKTDWLGNPYKETTGPDGRVKSTSRERTDWLGNTYTESTGGTSGTKHTTRTRTTWTGKKYRETQ